MASKTTTPAAPATEDASTAKPAVVLKAETPEESRRRRAGIASFI